MIIMLQGMSVVLFSYLGFIFLHMHISFLKIYFLRGICCFLFISSFLFSFFFYSLFFLLFS
uniref:Uncharacterized protein n=1 Tax=Arundo donax TaxID=35708 RepID=A0A0A9DV80_ARUDO